MRYVHVTEDQIELGNEGEAESCTIALAFLAKGYEGVVVSDKTIETSHETFHCAEDLQQWIKNFDNEDKETFYNPFTIILDQGYAYIA